jgi:hypothetical protein
MAVIRKKIENLKIGKEYIATVRAKNTDLNTYSDYTDSIRFIVPSDSTIPEVLQNFKLYASYKNVMFVFDNSTERDVVAYEYELYHQDDITGPEPFEINSGADPIISGVGYSNVIAVPLTEDYIQGYSDINTRVDGDGNEITVYYYGRVRAIDSSNNIGDWTPIRESESTKLIDDQFIVNLTASKITAGTIKASEIILAQAGASTTVVTPANISVLRSADYDGSYNSTTSSWNLGEHGWIIAGDGYAEFSSGVIRGGLKAGSVFINTNNRWNADTSGNPYASGNANEGYFKAGSSSKYLEWNPVTNTLNIAGNLIGATGTFSGSLSAATGSFAGSLSAATGTFAGELSAATGSFAGSLSAATGTFAGTLSAGVGIVSPVISGGTGNFTGTITVGSNATFSNRISIVSASTAADTKIYSGTGTYSNANTGFYLDASGRFSLKDDFTWDGSILNITGSIRSASSSGRVEFGSLAGDTRTIRFVGGEGGTVTLRNPEGESSLTNRLRINVGGAGGRTYDFELEKFATSADINSGGTINGASITSGGLITGHNFRVSGAFIAPSQNVDGTVNNGGLTERWAAVRTRAVDGGANNLVLRSQQGLLPPNNRTNLEVTNIFTNTVSGTPVHYGTGVLYGFTSRREYKENITDLSNGLRLVKNLKPRKFTRKPQAFDSKEAIEMLPLKWEYGFVAEEVAEVDHNLAIWEHPNIWEIEDDEQRAEAYKDIASWVPQTWGSNQIIAVLVSSVKELCDRMEKIEKYLGDINE